ncbi:MAG: SIR2 family protein [Sedimentisphaerales bacterium]|nr:SIR2 family protein [Sedimentisphaerales bacterium]
MTDTETENSLREIISQIAKGKVVLFLGAGASHSAGGPSGKKLTQMIKSKFPKIDQDQNDFIEVCQDVVDTPPYDKNNLDEFVREKLLSLQPSSSHKAMTRYNWAAIFTTNFDDLVEVAYRTTPDASKRCIPVYSDNPQVTPGDRSKVHLFKMMGCMQAQASESGQMVLSRADYNRALKRRGKYLELLLDFTKAGTIVFVGYSFGDRLALDVIDEVRDRYGIERLPWSYALFDKLETSEKSTYMFQSRKVRPVECSYEDFFTYLEKNGEPSKKMDIARDVHIQSMGYDLRVSEEQARQDAEYFEVLTEEKFNEEAGEKDDFFKGINKSWGAFREGWDFKRSLYMYPQINSKTGVSNVGLKDRVSAELTKRDTEENKVLLITGMAGVGKTMLLRRIAHDAYKGGFAPVVFINASRVNFDYKRLASLMENLNHQVDKQIADGGHTQQIKHVIIVDDAASFIRHINRLKDYLTSRGRSALVIAAERKGEWEAALKKHPFRIAEENVYELDEELSDEEKGGIIEHFYDLGYIQNKGTFWDDIIQDEFENSFFATIYTLVHPSKKPLNEIIRDQYKSLSNMTRRAFQYICCFHQFNLSINFELLVRSLKCPFTDFHSEVIERDAAKVIFEEPDEIGNILYRTHHRIIARKTVEFFFGDPEEQKNVFLEILNEAVLTNHKEREICEELLIEHIGPNAKVQTLSSDQQRQIFRTICEKNRVRALVHHWGILETDDKNYSEAERLLRLSLEIPREDIEAYRGESDQTILTSLGNLYSHMGIKATEDEDEPNAKDYFDRAEQCFRDAKYGDYPNAHAYHAHGNMWYQKGNRTAVEVEKLEYYAKSLEILEIAKDNVNEDDLKAIYELESMIWAQLGDEKMIKRNIDVLRVTFNTPSGYYLRAQLLWQKAFEKQGEGKEKDLQWALEAIETGLKFFPSDEHCLRLKTRLVKELPSFDLYEYFKSLQSWKSASSVPNVRLLYELGRTTFILGYYDHSKAAFQELETGVGIGHRLRSRTRDLIVDKEGRRKSFDGTVVNKISQYDGEIRCDTLRSLRYPIAFRPISCRFTPARGDVVTFYIGFTFRGPIALNVRKI